VISTIVTPSVNIFQVLALIAAIVFFVGFVMDLAVTPRLLPGAVLFAGLVLIALALMFGL
jgi:hypothetical protein